MPILSSLCECVCQCVCRLPLCAEEARSAPHKSPTVFPLQQTHSKRHLHTPFHPHPLHRQSGSTYSIFSVINIIHPV